MAGQPVQLLLLTALYMVRILLCIIGYMLQCRCLQAIRISVLSLRCADSKVSSCLQICSTVKEN